MGRPLKHRNVNWPEIVVSNSATRISIELAEKRGILRKIGSRLYTSNLLDDPAKIVKRHWPFIVNSYFPDAVIVDRSAASKIPIVEGILYLAHPRRERDIQLPGLLLRARSGSPYLSSDIPMGAGATFLASIPRTIIENVLASRSGATSSRRLTKIELEQYIDRILREKGENELTSTLNQIPTIAQELSLPQEGKVASALLQTFLGQRLIVPRSKELISRLEGYPYDPIRLELLGNLANYLSSSPMPSVKADASQQPLFPFFESYFSNYIEGIEFEINEAWEIIQNGTVREDRIEDSHDILGTYTIVSEYRTLKIEASSFNEFFDLLCTRHAVLMQGRRNMNPGILKNHNNRAGSTYFVDKDLVKGTLREGYMIGCQLSEAMARALYTMFLISEVHPFNDGNGRLSRIFLNSALVNADMQRIIVPTYKRNDYLPPLKAASNNGNFGALTSNMLSFQTWSHEIPWHTFEGTRDHLEKLGAFQESEISNVGLALVEIMSNQKELEF